MAGGLPPAISPINRLGPILSHPCLRPDRGRRHFQVQAVVPFPQSFPSEAPKLFPPRPSFDRQTRPQPPPPPADPQVTTDFVSLTGFLTNQLFLSHQTSAIIPTLEPRRLGQKISHCTPPAFGEARPMLGCPKTNSRSRSAQYMPTSKKQFPNSFRTVEVVALALRCGLLAARTNAGETSLTVRAISLGKIPSTAGGEKKPLVSSDNRQVAYPVAQLREIC